MSDIRTISGATSKGNQPKFIKGNLFYKIDSMGYESISEALVSEFLKYVDDVDYIDYFLDEVEYRGQKVCCCYSEKYTSDDESIITVYRLLKEANKLDGLKKYNGVELVRYVIDSVEEVIGLNIENYLSLLTVIDSIILNEDRHLNNIILIKKGSEYRVGPIFDNGLSLLSDVEEYSINRDLIVLIRKVKCKPFSTSFKKQLSYFNIKPLVVDYNSFILKLEDVSKNIDDYIPFKKGYYKRAKTVLLKRLEETKGVLWVQK